MTQPLDPTLLSRLKALHEKAGKNKISPSWMYTAIRHCQRNMDFEIEENDGEAPDRYDGTYYAELINAFPALLAHIEAQDGRIKAQHDRIEEISESALKMREVLHQAGYEWVMNYGWAKKTHTEAK